MFVKKKNRTRRHDYRICYENNLNSLKYDQSIYFFSTDSLTELPAPYPNYIIHMKYY